ncbi:6-pyruvoyl-tetrahydropterin synthase [Cenarchaeum symbiosum A]|uniref:6-pyruvoyl-tetrahydropterin synthase n=1 Tax=Cenarchaeum symbiosum (strain A) TaxID=414004 RepID=A0RWH6_CENSY|nr:6-pyruvoyl-tetrahydropterin synthase [Cenarchaeum symbiosum A]
MTSEPAVLDSDFRYLDGKGNLLRTRTELAVAKMLSFLGHDYEYNHKVQAGGQDLAVDFKTDTGLIEVIDGDEDVEKYRALKKELGGSIMAIGRPKYHSRIGELQDVVFYDGDSPQGSIFIEDQSFTFDYAHVLPLVDKCSVLHGHTSSVMVELAGQMKDGMLVDFGKAKGIIKQAISSFDHKFFVHDKYAHEGSPGHYDVSFKGPRGEFHLTIPVDTAYLLPGEATVESLSSELIRLLEPELPPNIEAVGVYIYEGYNKGSHIVSRISGA